MGPKKKKKKLSIIFPEMFQTRDRWRAGRQTPRTRFKTNNIIFIVREHRRRRHRLQRRRRRFLKATIAAAVVAGSPGGTRRLLPKSLPIRIIIIRNGTCTERLEFYTSV